MGSHLTKYGIACFILGLILLALMLRMVVRRIRFHDNPPPYASAPAGANFLLILSAIVFIVLAQAFFWLSTQTKYFRPLGKESEIGSLLVERSEDPTKSMKMHYMPGVSDSGVLASIFYLSGDSWRLSGEIINFKFANGLFGLPDRACKTVEFNGRYLGRIPPSTTGALLNHYDVEGGASKVYELFRDSRYLNWFADVDTFATDFIGSEKLEKYLIKLEKDGSVGLEKK
jgi:hypothetical protein